MQYRKNKDGEPLSLLGFGCMRFQRRHGNIDMEEAEKEILQAIKDGVNYFDTAYIYTGSEEALGTILEKNHCREKINIATKLPQYMLKKNEDFDRYFEEQCKRLKTDYIDYYLMHMLSDVTAWERLIEVGALEWLQEKKASGRIKHVGFSYHGNTEEFIKLLDAYDWDFCQIQYNYMDEHSQAGKRGLLYAASKQIPVIIMEPLRGGRLTNGLPKQAIEVFEHATPKRTPAEWAFRWLYNQPEVSVVLSGMNSMEMLAENVRIASETKVHALEEEELQVYELVKKAINQNVKVGCTGCGYCMPCPKGVDIPGTFRCYNIRYSDGFMTAMKEYIRCTTLRSKKSYASLCVECGRCEKHCPQHIPIRKELKNAKNTLEHPIYRVARFFMKFIFSYKK